MNEIRLYCGEHDMLCFRCNVGKVLTADGTYFDTGLPNGFSDLLVLRRGGITYFVEVKTPTGKQRDDQKNFEKIVVQYGFKYILAHSLQEFIKGLEV